MQGKRVDYDPTNPDVHPFPMLKEGEYGKSQDGTWYCITPNGLLGNISRHQITEHEDGTITVSPSILVAMRPVSEWHGFLKNGVWEEC